MSLKSSRINSLVEYNERKLWFFRAKDALTLGITSESVDEIGEATRVNFPALGEKFEKDDVLCEIDGEDGAVKLYAPASGEIISINDALNEDIQVLNEDPVDEGWLLTLKIRDETELNDFL